MSSLKLLTQYNFRVLIGYPMPCLVEALDLDLTGVQDDADADHADANESNNALLIDVAFPRLRRLVVDVTHGFGGACGRDVLRFSQRCCNVSRLSHLSLRTDDDPVRSEGSEALFTFIAQRLRLASLQFDGGLALPCNTLLQPDGVAEAEAAAAAAEGSDAAQQSYLLATRDAMFVGLQRLEASVTHDALATLARSLPESVVSLRLDISACAGASSINDRSSSADSHRAREPPLMQIVAAAAAPRLPHLRELVVCYDARAVSVAELAALRRLTQLEALQVSRWDAEEARSGCPCCWDFPVDRELDSPDFTDADLERLLAGMPRLTRLKLGLRSRMSRDAQTLVRRRNPQLKEVYLGMSRRPVEGCNIYELIT